MARNIKTKELVNTSLDKSYGGWIRCESCRQTIGYLCYVTYDSIYLEYRCKCGNNGSLHIDIEEFNDIISLDKELITIKNRLCCPEEGSPLITILQNKLDSFTYHIVCKSCHNEYHG